jgi:hypothetical protein
MAARILSELGFDADEIEASMAYFEKHGGKCDCTILMNIDAGEPVVP